MSSRDQLDILIGYVWFKKSTYKKNKNMKNGFFIFFFPKKNKKQNKIKIKLIGSLYIFRLCEIIYKNNLTLKFKSNFFFFTFCVFFILILFCKAPFHG